MTIDEAEAFLRRNIVAELGEGRAAELDAAIRSTAKALALVLNEPVPFDASDPDYVRPLA